MNRELRSLINTKNRLLSQIRKKRVLEATVNINTHKAEVKRKLNEAKPTYMFI